MKNISLAIAVMWIATAVAVIFAIYTTKSAWCLWANIKKVYYGCTKEDAGNIGFRDDIIYQYLKGENKDLINLQQMDRNECIKAFEEYKKENGVIY